MTSGRPNRRNLSTHLNRVRKISREENFFLAMIGCSLLLHLITAAFFQYKPAPSRQHRAPTVTVDLVLPPVVNPQRGNTGRSRPKPLPEIAPVTPLTPEKPAEVQPEKAENPDDISTEISKMRNRLAEQAARAELQEAQETIAALKKKVTAEKLAKTMVGTPTGTGDEAGGAIGDWLQMAVKKNWVWPGKWKNIQAKVEVKFDAGGKLIAYRIKEPSGDDLFDKSLLTALAKLEPLPKTIRKPFEETIVFNLEDLQRP